MMPGSFEKNILRKWCLKSRNTVLIVIQIRYSVYILKPQLKLQFEFLQFLVVFAWQNLHNIFWSYGYLRKEKTVKNSRLKNNEIHKILKN